MEAETIMLATSSQIDVNTDCRPQSARGGKRSPRQRPASARSHRPDTGAKSLVWEIDLTDLGTATKKKKKRPSSGKP